MIGAVGLTFVAIGSALVVGMAGLAATFAAKEESAFAAGAASTVAVFSLAASVAPASSMLSFAIRARSSFKMSGAGVWISTGWPLPSQVALRITKPIQP